MFRSHRAAIVAGIVLLSGCSAGGHTEPIVAGGQGSSVQRAPLDQASAVPVTGTLYYATAGSAYAIPLSSNGSTTAARTITPHPNQNNHVVEDIAVNADGTLDILEDYFTGVNQSDQRCRVVVEPADANGSPVPTNVLCDANDLGQGDQVAKNYYGGFDVLYADLTTSKNVIRRWTGDGASVVNTLVLSGYPFHLATNPRGVDDVNDNGGNIYAYLPTTTDPSQVVATTSVSAPNGLGRMIVAPDKTIYIVNGGFTTGQVIDVILPGTATVARSIGPFGYQGITALAVDSAGQLYVALESNGSSGGASTPANIRVYGAGASGKPVPLRIIAPQPAVNEIRGLAVFETPSPPPTAMPSLSPSPGPSSSPAVR